MRYDVLCTAHMTSCQVIYTHNHMHKYRAQQYSISELDENRVYGMVVGCGKGGQGRYSSPLPSSLFALVDQGVSRLYPCYRCQLHSWYGPDAIDTIFQLFHNSYIVLFTCYSTVLHCLSIFQKVEARDNKQHRADRRPTHHCLYNQRCMAPRKLATCS